MKAESWWNQRNKANSWQACYGFWWNGAFMYHQEIYESAMNGMLLPSILSGLYLVHHPRIRAICWLQKGLAVFPIACHTFPMKALSKKYLKKCVSELRKKSFQMHMFCYVIIVFTLFSAFLYLLSALCPINTGLIFLLPLQTYSWWHASICIVELQLQPSQALFLLSITALQCAYCVSELNAV